MPESIKLVATKTSPCSCGNFVHRNDTILWNKKTRKTVGCQKCSFTGKNPDPEETRMLDAFSSFHK